MLQRPGPRPGRFVFARRQTSDDRRVIIVRFHRPSLHCLVPDVPIRLARSADIAAISIALHEAAGFRRIGTFDAVGFKFGRWLDSVLMQRPLGKGAAAEP